MVIQQPEIFFPPGPPPSEMILIAMSIVAALIGAIYILGPLARALARRIEGRGGDAGVQEELHALRERVADMDGIRDRVLELEERIDFAERLLSQPPQPERLPHGER